MAFGKTSITDWRSWNSTFTESVSAHAVTRPPPLLPLCAQREVLQAGRPHAHVGEALARVGPGHPAPHRGPHLHALGRQWEEGSVGVRGEGWQRLSQRSSQGVS